MEEVERLICKNTQDEGFGSVYERISLSRLLKKLKQRHNFVDVLEFPCKITKGYDNLILMNEGCNADVADFDLKKIKSLWKFSKKPNFISIDSSKRYDLVWNFAMLQLNPLLLDKMIKKTKKYVLVLTPNILNYGTFFHFIYHLLSGTKCEHAEQGMTKLRMRQGLIKIFKEKNIKIVESGYIDLPFWPDTAFSIKEVKKNLFHIKLKPEKESVRKNEDEVLNKINKMMGIIENNKTMRGLFEHIFAHHAYVLGEINE